MTQLDQLPPDQRASLSLILRQGRTYEDVAALLHIEPQTVRRRALSALEALGPRDTDALPDERRDEVGDYLLGQQTASQRGETREYLEESAGGRAWGRVVASELRPLAAGALGEIPPDGFVRDPEPEPEPEAETEAETEPQTEAETEPETEAETEPEPWAPPPPAAAGRRDEPVSGPAPPPRLAPALSGATRRRRTGRSGSGGRAALGGRSGGAPAPPAPRSRVGQAVLLLGLGVIVAALIILILEGVIFGGSGNSGSDTATLGSSSSSATAPTTTSITSAATSSTPRIVAQIQFTPTRRGGHAAAVANVAQQGSQKAFALVAQGLAPTKGFAYAVWLYNPGANAQPLGFINQPVGSDGRAAAEGVLPSNASHFKQVVITQETVSKPTRPGTIVLVGQLNP